MALSSLRTYGRNYVSYTTMIRQYFGGVSIGNVTQYEGVTTRRHQKLAGVHSCDVQLDNIPQGAGDLLTIALERGMVQVNGLQVTINKESDNE